ncbi:MAG: beta-lactamase family protein, partial [Chloroflexi bacterium]|nr:beta-lactamase family protein [Chloroflexota bacterium]
MFILLQKRNGRLLTFTILLITLLFTQTTAMAAAPVATPSQTAILNGLTDPAELESFLDEYLAKQMTEHHIPGAVVTFVKDGELFLSKGYGYADLDSQTPFDPEQTLLTTASIGKVFTAVSVLQLAEQGLIELHDDVTPYLGEVQLPNRHPEALTFHHLLTHTDGFEARMIGGAALTESDLVPLATLLNDYMPDQPYAPGEYMTYGNFAANLAGHLAAEIGERPFLQLTHDNIFTPLGMSSSTFDQRLSDEMTARLATGYEYADSDYLPVPFFYIRYTPEGGLRTTANDMSRFLLALLNDGTYDGGHILNEATTASMLTPQFRPQPQMSGISYGLFEHLENGRQLFLRDGDGVGTRSRMVLFPDEEMGFFISYNSGSSALRLDIINAILDRYYPTEELALSNVEVPMSGYQERVDRFTGSYRPLQADATTFGKSMYFFSQQVEIKAEDGLLSLTSTGMGDERSSTMGGFEGTTQWVEVAPLQFAQVDGKGQIAFGEDGNGRITHLYSGQGYHSAFGKLAWYESQSVQIIVLELAALLIISLVVQAFVGWPVGLLVRKVRGREINNTVWADVSARLWAAFVSGLLALFIFRAIGVLYAIDTIGGLPNFVWGISDEMVASLNAIYLPALMVLTLPLLTAWAWVRGWWKLGGRIHYTLVTLSTFALIWWAWYWQL